MGPGKANPLNESTVDMVYRMAFLQVFSLWEVFLEESFCAFVMREPTRSGFCEAGLIVSARTAEQARNAVLGGAPYVSWANPPVAVAACKRVVTAGRHESVLTSAATDLESLAKIRHAVAHSSQHSKREFESAAIALGGLPKQTRQVGGFLRATTVIGTKAEKWLTRLTKKLTNLAQQVAC